MDNAFALGLGLIAGVLVMALRRSRTASQPITLSVANPIQDPERERAARDEPQLPDSYLQCAHALGPFVAMQPHPASLVADPLFQRGVELMCSTEITGQHLLEIHHCGNIVLSMMALFAIARRKEPIPTSQLLRGMHECPPVEIWALLRTLQSSADRPRVGPVLRVLERVQLNSLCFDALRDFFSECARQGEAIATPENTAIAARLPQALRDALRALGDDEIEELLDGEASEDALGDLLGDDLPKPLAEFVRSVGDEMVIGRDPQCMRFPAFERALARMTGFATGSPRRSVLVSGGSGVGKTTLLRGLARELRKQEFVCFEASASDLLAGQMYVGMLDARLSALRDYCAQDDVIWFIPNLADLASAGRHRENPRGVLESILPAIERGEMLIAAECDSQQLERLLAEFPRLRSALEVIALEPMAAAEAADLVIEARTVARTPIERTVVAEAISLAQQYLPNRQLPGALFELLERAEREKAGPHLVRDDLLRALAVFTGIPLDVLDEQRKLDLTQIRAFFEKRVIGQSEAIDALVERIAILKAGLADPSRPLGVFFFTGPTGTGKTELAKALAESLFGSRDRLVRIDMSELRDEGAISRLIGDPYGDGRGARSLVDRIREQPFSVVLLDEFEKANSQVFDLFLQLFDDGRLTDRRGHTADFRHAIVIMTSNLGGEVVREGGMGFRSATGSGLKRALEGAFRREFLNRIDRIVTFEPLSRAVMRDILKKELDGTLERRGLRTRSWAVEWEPSAIDFLLEKGFTTDLGARPLRRAIERYLLAPLARTIVEHEAPRGDQFLFVRGTKDRLTVEFVDPDAPDEISSEAAPIRVASTCELDADAELLRIAREPLGERVEAEFLNARIAVLARSIGSPEWSTKKNELFGRTGEAGFWRSADRFAVLGLAEYMDRVEVAFEHLLSLGKRLLGDRESAPRELLTRCARRTILLERTLPEIDRGELTDVFLAVEASRESGIDPIDSDANAKALVAMYRGFCEAYGMKLDVLDERRGDAPYRAVLAISGIAARASLLDEDGLHVFETRSDGRPLRLRVKVRVVPQPPEPAGDGEPLAQAEEALGAERGTTDVVRKYRAEPSPLVRDTPRRYRTGLLHRVLAGDFDLFGGVDDESEDEANA